MTSATPTPALLERHLRSIFEERSKLERRDLDVVGFRGRWSGPPKLLVDGRTCRVVSCPSALAFREQLAEHQTDGETVLVLFTERPESELGTDVLSRLPRRHLQELEIWTILEEAFGATRIDPRLLREPWLAYELLATAGPSRMPTVGTGFLDLETAWAFFLSERLGMAEGRTDATALLRWSLGAYGTVLENASEEVKSGVERRFASTAGVVGEVVARLAAAGRSGDAVALGLVSRVIFDPASEGQKDRGLAAGRLEGHLGGLQPEPAAGLAWAEAAEAVVASLAGDPTRQPVFDAVLARADQLSSELKVRPWTHLSAILPSGLIGRMEVYATALRTALDGKSTVGPNALEAAAQLVLEHLTARGLRVGGVQMSLRLARWLVTRGEAEGAASFPAMAHEYLEQESFVDWARDALHGSEVSEPLASAYRELLIRIGERRERANHRFGELVRQWFEHDSAELSLVPVEEILERIVAPLVDVGPCLVLVVDGLALPVFHQLLAGLTAAGWVELASAETGRAVGLAALPSVTQVCRGALLRGSLGEGGQSEEKLGFEGHPTLRARSGGALPPVLFHKGGLRDDGGGALADEVRSEMLNPRRLIVGVVVNAVDDFLLRGDQLVPEWGVETIRPLAALLEAATVAGRTVILTADHGHVLEHGQEYRKVVGAGERNRPVSDVPMGGEVKVRGRRVVTPTHEIVVPWSETVRYGKMKNGYHGGATPQELLVPVAILTRGKVPGGWSALPPLLPSWWDLAEPRDEAAARPAGGERAIGKRSAAGQLPLFGGAKAAATSPWILKLVGSSVFKRQKELASRSAPQDAELQALLEALADRGGKMTRPALSQLLQRPASSLQGFLAAVERMLNVEGYAALEVTQDAVTLNREILDAQFELGE